MRFEYIHRDKLTLGLEGRFKHTPRDELGAAQGLQFDNMKISVLRDGLKYPLTVFDNHVLIGMWEFEALCQTVEYFPCVVLDKLPESQVAIVQAANQIKVDINRGDIVIPLNEEPTIMTKAPLNAMSLKELKALAKDRGVDITGLRKKVAIIDAIETK